MLNPIWLTTFKTLIDTGHFTKTAEKLFMTQPGVSQHINKLEHACGYSLIKRDKKRFEITEQGRILYQYACQTAENEQQLFEQLAFDEPYKGACSLACSGALALRLYPKLLDLQAHHADLLIQLKAAPHQQILSQIQSGTIDIGIVTNTPASHLFDIEELGKEELCLVLPKAVDTKNGLESTLLKLGLISHPDAEHYLSLYFARSQEHYLATLAINELPIRGVINQISQILQPVAKGLGFTILPKSAVDCFQNANALQIYTPANKVVEKLYQVKKKNRELPARYTAFSTVIKEALAK